MKRKFTNFLTVLLLLASVPILMNSCSDDSVSKEEIFDYVKENQELLESFPYDEYEDAIEAKDSNDNWETISSEFCIAYFGEDTIIKSVFQDQNEQMIFHCGGSGIGLGKNTYCGFYYSPQGVVSPEELEDLELSEIEDGIYDGKSSSGRCYARHEKIADNWYYFYEEYKNQSFFLNT